MVQSKKLIIFTDIGDTIIDETTEIRKIPHGIVYKANCIPGAKETYLKLFELGYTIAMVADGYVESFENTMEQNGLSHIFSVKSISETVGVEKPEASMFETAFQLLRLKEEDKKRIIMVGNRLERDVVGAKRFGITSVHLAWSKRYKTEPECQEEKPDYQIQNPEELLELVEKLEQQLS